MTPKLYLSAALCLCFHLTVMTEAGVETHYLPTLVVSAPHLAFTCPEGANITMQCVIRGTTKYAEDRVKFGWLFTPHQNQHCHDSPRPRSPKSANHSHAAPKGVHYGDNKDTFWITLVNVKASDQGRYCCVALDIHNGKQKPVVEQRPHSHHLLTITPSQPGNTNCTVIDHKPPEGTVPAALATAGCIMGILSLPLILLLVYKQRQMVQSNRRAHELVRMDSEAQGHDNPVFTGGSPPIKTRTVSQIMRRQSSEVGGHLLSDPGTPISPIGYGEVFFPSQEPIPESPDFMQV